MARTVIGGQHDGGLRSYNLPDVSCSFTSANIIRASVATNCPRGGDTGHGGRTYITLTDEASTDWWLEIETDGDSITNHVRSICIGLGGDCENETIMLALEFIVNQLRHMVQLNTKNKGDNNA